MFGLSDLLAYGIHFFITTNNYLAYIITNYFAFLSFFEKKYLLKRWYFFLLIFLLMVGIWFLTDNWRYHAVMHGLTYVYIVFGLGYEFMLGLIERKFSFTLLIIITHIFILVFFMVILSVFDYSDTYYSLYFTMFVGMFFGLFFTIFRIDDDRFITKL